MSTLFKWVAVLFFMGSLQAHAFETYFSPLDSLDDVVIEEVNKAKKSLDISIYTFNSTTIRQAIIDKMNDNPDFKVRIVVWKSNRKSTTEFLEPLRQIINERKTEKYELIRYVTVTNHHKYMIVDGKRLVSTSGNFNNSKLAASYDENLTVCSTKCKSLVKAFQKEFDYLFTNSNALTLEVKDADLLTPLAPPKRSKQAIFTSYNFNMVAKGKTVSMRVKSKDMLGEVEGRLIDVIANAKKSIKIATGHFRTWTLLKALEKAKKRGVDVQLLLDSQEYISAGYQSYENDKRDTCLEGGKTLEQCYKAGFHFGRLAAEKGITVFIKYYMTSWDFIFAPQMHHKYMIVDGKTLYTGSYNWSKNAEFKTVENVAIIKDKKTVAKYEDNYDYLKSYGEGEYEKLTNRWSKAKKKLQLKFKPMTLSVSAIDDLRAIACEKCPSVFCPAKGVKRIRAKAFCTVE